MAKVIDEREAFDAEFFRPPHLARMLECAGLWTGRLDNADRSLILEMALENFWQMRDAVRVSNDILRLWDRALSQAAQTRPKWRVITFALPGAPNGHEWRSSKRLKDRR